MKADTGVGVTFHQRFGGGYLPLRARISRTRNLLASAASFEVCASSDKTSPPMRPFFTTSLQFFRFCSDPMAIPVHLNVAGLG
jgi:hypothetical protein